MARTTLAWLTSQRDVGLHDLCYSASLRRSHHDHRLALVVHSQADMAECLQAFQRGEHAPGLVWGQCTTGQPPLLVFVFSGQGPQWPGMGRQLLAQEPVFRAIFEECDRLLRQFADWSLVHELTTGAPGAWRDGVRYVARLVRHTPQGMAMETSETTTAGVALFQAEGTYLLTGGLGGVGLRLAP